ncbi:hypothetical protein QEH59_13580 [Coraliomargarita sp. SDUM461004]|uniref:Energy transducer TonB n=1 Tax=Thalassobacterium sedimentorum TaxID=3041258 RepID=A0ABU1AKX3_9BACT|nr:hypothetical protein [Coraliomargarita sp. SDUM461004]
MKKRKRKTKQYDRIVEAAKIQAATIIAAWIVFGGAIIAAMIGFAGTPVPSIPVQPIVIEEVQIIQQFNYYKTPNPQELLHFPNSPDPSDPPTATAPACQKTPSASPSGYRSQRISESRRLAPLRIRESAGPN